MLNKSAEVPTIWKQITQTCTDDKSVWAKTIVANVCENCSKSSRSPKWYRIRFTIVSLFFLWFKNKHPSNLSLIITKCSLIFRENRRNIPSTAGTTWITPIVKDPIKKVIISLFGVLELSTNGTLRDINTHYSHGVRTNSKYYSLSINWNLPDNGYIWFHHITCP